MNMLVKIFFLQMIIAVVVVIVLKVRLERELILQAMERLASLPVAQCAGVASVTILTAGAISPEFDRLLRKIVKEKFPSAQLEMVVNKAIMGGVVVQAGEVLVDSSLSNRLKHLWG